MSDPRYTTSSAGACQISGKVAGSVYDIYVTYGSTPEQPATFRVHSAQASNNVVIKLEPGSYVGTSGSVVFANRLETADITLTASGARPVKLTGDLGC